MGLEYKEPVAEPIKKDDEIKNNPPPAQNQEPKNIDPTDDDIIKLLQKRGVTVSSLDDLKPQPTPEEIKAQDEARKNKMLAYGLETGKIKKEDYDSFNQKLTRKEQIAVSKLEAELRKDNTLTEDQIQDYIRDYTLAVLDDENPVKKYRAKELELLGESELRNEYKNIYDLPAEYGKHEERELNDSKLKRKVEAALPVYRADIDKIIETIRKEDILIEDKENPENNKTIPFEYSAESIKELKDFLSDGKLVLDLLKNGYDINDLTNTAKNFLIVKNHHGRINFAAKKHLSDEKEKFIHGRKGLIVPADISTKSQGAIDPDDPRQVWKQKAMAEIQAGDKK